MRDVPNIPGASFRYPRLELCGIGYALVYKYTDTLSHSLYMYIYRKSVLQ